MRTRNVICILTIMFLIPNLLLFSEETLNQDSSLQQLPVNKADISAHEVYLGYGYPNSISPMFVGGIQTFLTALFSGGTQNTSLHGAGVIQAGYNWYCIPDNGFSVGGIITFEPYKIEHINTKTPENNSTENILMTTIQGTVKYQYGWKYVRLYHGVSIGLGISSKINDNTTCVFAFNIIPIGIKAGKEQGINFFADVGVGSTPIINAGASYRF